MKVVMKKITIFTKSSPYSLGQEVESFIKKLKNYELHYSVAYDPGDRPSQYDDRTIYSVMVVHEVD